MFELHENMNIDHATKVPTGHGITSSIQISEIKFTFSIVNKYFIHLFRFSNIYHYQFLTYYINTINIFTSKLSFQIIISKNRFTNEKYKVEA